MRYADGFVAAVPAGNRDAYLTHARVMTAVLQAHGARRVVDSWADAAACKARDGHEATSVEAT